MDESTTLQQWMHEEGHYNITKFTEHGRPPEVEAELLQAQGILGEYWSGFIESYYGRYEVFRQVDNLRASQMLLKEAATTRIAAICLRLMQGVSFEAADRSSLHSLSTIAPPSHETTNPIVEAKPIERTVVRPLLNLLHQQIVRDYDLSNAQTIADHLVVIEGYAALRFCQKYNQGQLPAPGISSSEAAAPWER